VRTKKARSVLSLCSTPRSLDEPRASRHPQATLFQPGGRAIHSVVDATVLYPDRQLENKGNTKTKDARTRDFEISSNNR
jgi:hypothetical protein